MKRFLFCVVTAIVAACAASATRADILLSGDFQAGTTTPTLTISVPFTFNINHTGSFQTIDLDEWVTSDGTQTQLRPLPTGQTLLYRINGGAVQSVGLDSLWDNYAGTFSPYTPNDGLLNLSAPVPVSAGQTLTIEAQSFNFGSNPAFNPKIPRDYAGTAFAVSNAAIPLSPNTVVPEPSTWAAVALGAGLLFGATRRRSRA